MHEPLELLITPVTRAQFPVWKRLREALYRDLDPAFHAREIEWLFASPQAAAFIASACGEAVGLIEVTLRNFVDGCIGGPVGYIDGLFLAPEHRGRGHGRRMIEFAAEWFRAQGCRNMGTDAEIDNVAAQEFYSRLGFTERWRTVGFTKALDVDETAP